MKYVRFKCRCFSFRVAPLFLLLVLIEARVVFSQSVEFSGPPAVDVLGAHDNAGRGCASCHVPHSGALSSDAGTVWLWGATAAPEYGRAIPFQSQGSVVEVTAVTFATGDAEVSGIIVCVSCHDGNVTPQNMMASRSYAQRIGLQPFVPGVRTPTMLGDDLAAQFKIDHPLGQGTNIPLGSGLAFVNGKFEVEPDSAYARFVKSYGWPSLAPAQRSSPYGVDREGQPYVVCTTCHNQHAMSVFASRPGDAIEGDDSGRLYTTFFFVNGPYDPTIHPKVSYSPTSSMQFCRQCHFDLSNEAHNTEAPTVFD
jgi:hypothetical protein